MNIRNKNTQLPYSFVIIRGEMISSEAPHNHSKLINNMSEEKLIRGLKATAKTIRLNMWCVVAAIFVIEILYDPQKKLAIVSLSALVWPGLEAALIAIAVLLRIADLSIGSFIEEAEKKEAEKP